MRKSANVAIERPTQTPSNVGAAAFAPTRAARRRLSLPVTNLGEMKTPPRPVAACYLGEKSVPRREREAWELPWALFAQSVCTGHRHGDLKISWRW